MQNFHEVVIIIVNWNGWQDTNSCLDSLKSLDYPNFRIIVIDNNSTDDSVNQISASHPNVNLIRTCHNLGFSGGCNVGISSAIDEDAEYVWLLNNDTVINQLTLKEMIILSDTNANIGAVGSRIYYMNESNKIQAWGGGSFSFWTGRTRHILSPASERKLHYITASSILIRCKTLKEIGFLDNKSFFMYWEDVDFSFRLRKAGWKIAVANDSIVYHKEHASTGNKNPTLDLYFNESAIRFYKRHTFFPLWPIIVGTTGRLIKRILEKDKARIIQTLLGAYRGLTSQTHRNN